MRCQTLLVFVVSLFLLAACVNTVDGVEKRQIDESKVLVNQINLGMKYLGIGDREGARIHFQKALKIDKKSAEAVNGMALVYQMEGELELAEEAFKRSLTLLNPFPMGNNNYGSFLYGQQRYEDAYQQFSIASSAVGYRNRAGALTNLGRTALKLQRPEKALASFEHAIKLDPRQSLALIELAELQFDQQNYSVSKKNLDQFGRVSNPTPRSLWLGIRIERVFGNKDKEASYALALKNLHPYSKEYLNYKKSQ